MGCGVEFKPKGYVIALFHAFNQSQSILLDYTRIGEVVQLKRPGEYLDTSDAGEEVEKSPYSSLEGVVSSYCRILENIMFADFIVQIYY